MKTVSALELVELNAAPTGTEPLVQRDLSLFGHVNVRVTAEIGHAELSIEKLLGSKSGDVISLVQTVETPITLLVNGKAVARGQLVAVDDNFGVQITEII